MSLKLILICAGMLAFLLNHALEAMYGLSGYVLGSISIYTFRIYHISKKAGVLAANLNSIFYNVSLMFASSIAWLLRCWLF